MKTLVVARHEEDLAWTDQVSVGWRVFVVQKGVHVENVGREASSFFWALERLRPKMRRGDVAAFVQGDPFVHCPDLFFELNRDFRSFVPLGNWRVSCDLAGSPHHPGLPLAEKYREWLGGEPPGLLTFTAGAQFAVTAREVRRFPRSFYAEMGGRMADGEAPWVMERLWEPLFTREKEARVA